MSRPIPTPIDHDSIDAREYQGMIGGIALYFNPTVPAGIVQLRNQDGEVIGTILNVKQIDTSGRL